MFSYDMKTQVLSGIEIPPFFHENVTLGQVIVHYLQREPARIVQACYDDGVDLSAGEMAKLGLRAAKNLLKSGLKTGDVVGLVCKNTTYQGPLVLGCLLAGLPISTMDPTFDVSEVSNIFRQTHPKLVFCDSDNVEVVTESLKRCDLDSEAITVDEKFEGFRHAIELFELLTGEREFVPHGFGIDSSKLCAVILCSSGTTAMSKGTIISHAQCLTMMTKQWPGIYNPTVLCFSSLYWLSGFSILMFSMTNCSKRIITKRIFSPLLMVHLIEQYKVNVVLSAPSQVARLVHSPIFKLADLSSVRMYLVGGGFIISELRKTLQDHLLYGALLVTYGMTEVAGLMACSLPFQKSLESVGKITPNTKLKIIDDDGNTLGPHEIGEIFIFNTHKFLGYANNVEDTRNAFDNGWLKTGDLGYFTDDGEIFIVDRKKEMIKYLNYQVAPSELEACIAKMEGIKAVCVVGIPDMITGDLATAVVVKDHRSPLTEQDIVDEIARKFPLFKRLHGGAFLVDELPLTPSGKIKKRLVRKQAAQMFRSHEINGNY